MTRAVSSLRLAAPALAIAALTALGVVGAAPALAVQTDTFVLTAVGSSRVLEVPRTGSTSAQAVEVDNRTAAPITLALVAVDAQRSPDGIYGYGAPNAGYSASVHVASPTITLAPHAQKIVAVEIDTPKGNGPEEYAAVTATQVIPGQQELTVQARLAVLVRLAGTAGTAVQANPQALVGHKVTRLASLPVLAVGFGIGALALSGASWFLLVLKRRRKPATPAGVTDDVPTDVTPDRELAGV